MDQRLTQLPDPAVEARVQTLVCDWCNQMRELCPCDPRPLPRPSRSPVVRLRQETAQRLAEPAETVPGPATPDTPRKPAEAPSGPVCSLSPKWGAA